MRTAFKGHILLQGSLLSSIGLAPRNLCQPLLLVRWINAALQCRDALFKLIELVNFGGRM
tara:strand:- start:87 stop:266 length:180 start_codon:yes stop_codon:yes gene_type:complete